MSLSPWIIPLYDDGAAGIAPPDGGGAPPASPNFLTSSWDKIEDWFSGKGADTTGMSPGMARSAVAAKSMQNTGLLLGIMGGINSAVGSYYAAQSQQYQLKSQALNFQYQGVMARMNSQAAERDAQSILEASKTQIGQYTMQAGQAKAGAKTEMAGRGLVLGQGSAREVEASMDIVKDVNVLNMNANAVRAAAAQRTAAQTYRSQSLLDDVSAKNATRGADSMSPFAGAFTSLLSSGSQVGMQWLAGNNRRLLEGVY